MSYSHTQKGPWLFIVSLVAAGLAIASFFAASENITVSIILVVSAAAVAALCFGLSYLTVEEEDDRLRIRFGPLPLLQKKIPYSDIVSVEPSRSNIIDGWGIHYTIGRGMIWNIWGFDCVRLTLKNGKPLRIGTDDVEGLVGHINERIGK